MLAPDVSGARDVCLVLLTGIGDAVQALPIANALREADSRRRITWVAEPPAAQLVRPHAAVDDVIVFRRGGVAALQELRERFRGRRFDLAVNAMRYFKGVIPTLLSGAPIRVGMDRRRARDAVWLAATHRLPDRPWRHRQDFYLEFVEFLGLPRPDPVEARLLLGAAEAEARDAFYARLERPAFALAVGSGHHRKDWPAQRYAALAGTLVRRHGGTVLIVGGPGRREAEAAVRVAREADVPVRDERADDVRRLLWLIDGADVVVSPDSAALHLAHERAVPVVGLFGHTNPAWSGPYRRFRDLVVDAWSDPGEAPDPSRIEPRYGRMERITVETVAERVATALARYPRREEEG